MMITAYYEFCHNNDQWTLAVDEDAHHHHHCLLSSAHWMVVGVMIWRREVGLQYLSLVVGMMEWRYRVALLMGSDFLFDFSDFADFECD